MADPDMIVKVEGTDYPLNASNTLRELTGKETILLEEYLGGWENFDLGGRSTRSMVVTVWLAMHANGSQITIDEIENMKGIVFGDTVDVEELPGPPASGAEAPTPSTPQEDSEDSGHGESLSDLVSVPATWTN